MKMLQSFFWGIIAALGALFLEIFILIFSNPLSINQENISKELFSFNVFFFATIFIEEISKYLFISKYIFKISRKTDLIYNAFFFGLGFSILEITMLYFEFKSTNQIDFLGISGILMVHISASLLIAFAFQKFSFQLKKIFFGFFPAFLIHLFYNLLNITEIQHQKESTFLLLILFAILDIFLLSFWLFERKSEDF